MTVPPQPICLDHEPTLGQLRRAAWELSTITSLLEDPPMNGSALVLNGPNLNLCDAAAGDAMRDIRMAKVEYFTDAAQKSRTAPSPICPIPKNSPTYSTGNKP